MELELIAEEMLEGEDEERRKKKDAAARKDRWRGRDVGWRRRRKKQRRGRIGGKEEMLEGEGEDKERSRVICAVNKSEKIEEVALEDLTIAMAPRTRKSRETSETPFELPQQDSQNVTITNIEESQASKRKRGCTKMKTIAVDPSSRIEVQFNSLGQAYGDGSVSLSSFLGPLVREIVPYTLTDWRKLPKDTRAILWQCIQAKINSIRDDLPKSSSMNPKEDALAKVLGPENSGRVRGFGKGVTLSKLSILTQRDNQMNQMKNEYDDLKDEVANLRSMINKLVKGQGHNQSSESCEEVSTAPITSPNTMNVNPLNKNCKILDWMGSGEIVAEGRWSSSDPKALVHHVPIGPNAMRVWVDKVRKGETFLWRPTSYMSNIEEAMGSTVAWPADKIRMDG
ncbi:hypothetical protein LWI29_035255 [Acer saccharum]|uniref:DUF8039 domain-containing protein n=1 Tax=Acer saccharum TaxID=4024 RepID=A0AA39RTC9_ACESA|nr:hypothetical protein LWI29_035255 [Acer saccharum]